MMFCGKPNLYLSRFHRDQENATGNRSSVRDASANSNRRFSVNFAPLVTIIPNTNRNPLRWSVPLQAGAVPTRSTSEKRTRGLARALAVVGASGDQGDSAVV